MTVRTVRPETWTVRRSIIPPISSPARRIAGSERNRTARKRLARFCQPICSYHSARGFQGPRAVRQRCTLPLLILVVAETGEREPAVGDGESRFMLCQLGDGHAEHVNAGVLLVEGRG